MPRALLLVDDKGGRCCRCNVLLLFGLTIPSSPQSKAISPQGSAGGEESDCSMGEEDDDEKEVDEDTDDAEDVLITLIFMPCSLLLPSALP